jgi:hypothetical protein
MGNASSKTARGRLGKELPPVKQTDWDDGYGWKDTGVKYFNDDHDREHFIGEIVCQPALACIFADFHDLKGAVLTVATSNGLTNLDDHDFKLMYSRRGENDDRIIARIVAIKDGAITAKIEPELDGADQVEAFKVFKKDVEVKLDRVLMSIPDHGSSVSASIAGPSRANAGGAEEDDDLPAYTSADVGMLQAKPGSRRG